jgi:Short C-terminal domain
MINGIRIVRVLTLSVVPLLFVLPGCQSIADVDLSAKDAACGQLCSTHYEDCNNRITMMPIRQHNDCADSFKYCAQACPAKGAATVVPGEKPSVADRLKELESLHQKGLISDDEYLAKKRAILDQL